MSHPLPNDTSHPSPSDPAALLSSLPPSRVLPPTFPAHLFEVVSPLYTLLDRVLALIPGEGADGAAAAAAAAAAAGEPAPLAIKDFQGEVLRVKHAAAAARNQLRGLPDLERGVEEQRAEFAALALKLNRARRVGEEMRRLAAAEEKGEDGQKKMADVDMGTE